MKKPFTRLVVALLLIPQIIISQYSMDFNHDISLIRIADIHHNSIQTIHSDPTLGRLQTFELLDQGSKNNVKVVASFLEKEAFILHIYNQDGLSIYEESFQTDELNLAMGFSNLPKGKYFFSLKTREGILIKEFK